MSAEGQHTDNWEYLPYGRTTFRPAGVRVPRFPEHRHTEGGHRIIKWNGSPNQPGGAGKHLCRQGTCFRALTAMKTARWDRQIVIEQNEERDTKRRFREKWTEEQGDWEVKKETPGKRVREGMRVGRIKDPKDFVREKDDE